MRYENIGKRIIIIMPVDAGPIIVLRVYGHPTLPNLSVSRRLHIPEMGDGPDGHVGRDDGLRDAGLPGHNAHPNGQARVGGHRIGDGHQAQLLPGPRSSVAQLKVQQDRARQGGLQRPVRLGRGDPGLGAVGVLLRLHNHPLAGRRAVPEIRRQAHHGIRHPVHGHFHPDDAVRGAHGLQAVDRPPIHRGSWRGEKLRSYRYRAG